ncbi:MAG: hypothetical protein CVT81_11900 [Alphaproteobacteria bacterium HGW-Alphaproteobacteria-3]|nr:MAG: hypothetical protein CVT81_11900 [Alphaproteobacteria bacterium HGW-Alphaproteobacteria-3]
MRYPVFTAASLVGVLLAWPMAAFPYVDFSQFDTANLERMVIEECKQVTIYRTELVEAEGELSLVQLNHDLVSARFAAAEKAGGGKMVYYPGGHVLFDGSQAYRDTGNLWKRFAKHLDDANRRVFYLRTKIEIVRRYCTGAQVELDRRAAYDPVPDPVPETPPLPGGPGTWFNDWPDDEELRKAADGATKGVGEAKARGDELAGLTSAFPGADKVPVPAPKSPFVFDPEKGELVPGDPRAVPDGSRQVYDLSAADLDGLDDAEPIYVSNFFSHMDKQRFTGRAGYGTVRAHRHIGERLRFTGRAGYGTVTNDPELKGFNQNLDVDPGWDLALGISMPFGKVGPASLRAGIEGGYQTATPSRITNQLVPGSLDVSGDYDQLSLMLTGGVEVPVADRIDGELTLGAGFNRTSLLLRGPGGGTIVDDNETVFAWRVRAALLYVICKGIGVGPYVQYASTGDMDTRVAGGGPAFTLEGAETFSAGVAFNVTPDLLWTGTTHATPYSPAAPSCAR